MTGYRSSLAQFAPMLREPDPANGREAAAKIWHETGLFVANPGHLRDLGMQLKVIQMAEQFYGKREKKVD